MDRPEQARQSDYLLTSCEGAPSAIFYDCFDKFSLDLEINFIKNESIQQNNTDKKY